MPVALNSRYHGVPVYDAADAGGAVHPTIGMRPAPPGPAAALYQHIVVGDQSLEYLAWRYLGSSQAWWRIADANPLVFPLDLPSGARVAIPSAGEVGRVERSRRF